MKMGDEEQKEEILQLKSSIKILNKELEKEQNKRKKLEGDRSSIHDALGKLEDELNMAQSQQAVLAHQNGIVLGKLKDATECQICCERKLSRALSCGHVFCDNCGIRFFDCEKCPTCLQKPLGIQCLFLC